MTIPQNAFPKTLYLCQCVTPPKKEEWTHLEIFTTDIYTVRSTDQQHDLMFYYSGQFSQNNMSYRNSSYKNTSIVLVLIPAVLGTVFAVSFFLILWFCLCHMVLQSVTGLIVFLFSYFPHYSFNYLHFYNRMPVFVLFIFIKCPSLHSMLM